MRTYQDFLESKAYDPPASDVEPDSISKVLYPFQAAIVSWAVRRGRASIFADCGMGKTLMQLEWLRQMGGEGLIVAPLSVIPQTIAEARKLGMRVERTEGDYSGGVQITNYERIKGISPGKLPALVLDESSILKSIDGKTRTHILNEFTRIPYRLACTATPAPNDLTELGNHAQFLGIMSFREMSATFFVKESDSTRWRLKGHAKEEFFRWLCTWAVYVREPRDVGFPDERFVLPPIEYHEHICEADYHPEGFLFPTLTGGIQGRHEARKQTVEARVRDCAERIRGNNEPWIVWCGLNYEGVSLAKELGSDARIIEGSTPEDERQEIIRGWINDDFGVLITKPSILGFGMNFQHCHNVAFLGVGDSYEQYYQAVRRCWRYGQTDPVGVHIFSSTAENQVLTNLLRKERAAADMAESIVKMMRDTETAEVAGAAREEHGYMENKESGEGWDLMLGDSTERLAEIEENSVGLSVFSPPFVSLYTYTNTGRDLGNSKDEGQFFEHFAFIIEGILRATMPGRLCCVHVAQVPAMLVRDGFIGMKDFRADTVSAFTEKGWIYHGEVVIDKDPQAQAIRTKAKGLLFTQLKKDASWLRPALADYILVFRKPGENPEQIKPEISNEDWIQWARPIWYGIQESKTLNYREARTDKDERHICPLQLETIERCVRLWSNPGDLVLSPFAGIGSEGYVAIEHGRRFVGCELKPEYYEIAKKNLAAAATKTPTLFASEGTNE